MGKAMKGSEKEFEIGKRGTSQEVIPWKKKEGCKQARSY
jgi:hypothetical protein